MVGAELAEGEEGANYDPEPVLDEEQERRRRVDREGGLWRREEEEEFYGEGECIKSDEWKRSGGSRAKGWGSEETLDGARKEGVLVRARTRPLELPAERRAEDQSQGRCLWPFRTHSNDEANDAS